MKKLDEYPIADIFPYQESLSSQLNDNTRSRTIYKGKDTEFINSTEFCEVNFKKIVDRTQFIKVFKDSLKTILALSTTAQKVLWYIIDNVPKEKPFVYLDYKECMDNVGFKTRKSVYDGVIELLEKGILTRSSNSKKYWVNPLVIFNGNLLSPPQVTAKTPTASTAPVIAGLSPNEPRSESAAAFACVMLPIPSEAATSRTQKIFAVFLKPSPRSI